LLRRRGTPAGGLALLCVVLVVPARAATPSPDPPPAAVAPEPPPVARTQPAPVRTAPVSTPSSAPVIHRTAPVTRAQPVQAAAAKPKPVVKKKPVANTKPVKRPVATKTVAAVPHDRARLPVSALVAADELNRGLLAFAGFALLLVALGGAMLLGVARRQLLLAALGLFVVFAPAAGAATAPTWTLVGTTGSNGWFKSNVTIRWMVDPNGLVNTVGCPVAEQITAEGTATRQCRADYSDGSSITSPNVTIKIDKTAPTGVSGSLARAADSEGWFNHPVAASFSGQDSVSGMAGCAGSTYSGVDSASAVLSGTCADNAGNTATASVTFKYDATPPTVAPSVDRAPDGKGWYRKPVTVSFAGTDLTSGIAACTAATRYEGPDQPTATVVGSCRDAAGNAAQAGHSFQYDATAPALPKTEAKVDKGVARIGWERAGDVVEVELVRSPGINGAKSTIVYRGNGAAFVDKTVKAGISYRYEISVADLAGNVTTKAVTAATAAKKSTSLLTPVAGAVVKAPPLLRWKAVKGATFYNVQVYRNGRKLLSTWPGAAKLKLARTWTYAGKRYRLQPGLYTWYVWGARGTRAKPVYGKVLGSSTFTVKR
jgi:hypothetical protein